MSVVISITTHKDKLAKERVKHMANCAVTYLDNAQHLADREVEKQRIREVVCHELKLSVQKMYDALGIEEAAKLIPWVTSVVDVDWKAREKKS